MIIIIINEIIKKQVRHNFIVSIFTPSYTEWAAAGAGSGGGHGSKGWGSYSTHPYNPHHGWGEDDDDDHKKGMTDEEILKSKRMEINSNVYELHFISISKNVIIFRLQEIHQKEEVDYKKAQEKAQV